MGAAVVEQRAGQLGAGGQRGVALARRHRGGGDEVGGPRRAAAVDAARRRRAAQADVGDDEGLFARAREDADGRLAAGGRCRDLARDGAVEQAGATRGVAVVGGEDQVGGAQGRRWRGARGGAPALDDVLQRAQAAGRLDQEVGPVACGDARRGIGHRRGRGRRVGGRPALVVDDVGQRASLRPARALEARAQRALVGPAHAQPGDGLDRVGDAQHGAQLVGTVEADPPDAETLGACGEPQVLDRAGRRVDVGRGDRGATQDLGPLGRRDAAHAHPDRRLEHAFDLLVQEGARLRPEARGLPRALALGQRADARAGLGGAHDDEAPGLRQPHGRSAMRCLEHSFEERIVDRVGAEAAHVAAPVDDAGQRGASGVVEPPAARVGGAIGRARGVELGGQQRSSHAMRPRASTVRHSSLMARPRRSRAAR